MSETTGKRHSERIFSGQQFGVTRISMPAGDRLPEHKTSQEAFLYLVSGNIRFIDASGEKPMAAGDHILIPAHVPHGVIAEMDSVFLLMR